MKKLSKNKYFLVVLGVSGLIISVNIFIRYQGRLRLSGGQTSLSRKRRGSLLLVRQNVHDITILNDIRLAFQPVDT